MLRDPIKSDPTVEGFYIAPDDIGTLLLQDFELGGTGLNNPDDGLLVQTWEAWYNTADSTVYVKDEAENVTPLFTMANIHTISLTFDQNMNPFVAYMKRIGETDEAWFWWFDTDLEDTVHTQLPAGSVYPVCSLDDKRSTQTMSSDIILAYVRANTLYIRVQRDRYLTEYTFHEGLDDFTYCRKVGMNSKNRLQFEMFTGIL